MDQMSIDSIRYLMQNKNWKTNRVNIKKIKSEPAALQEAVETIRSIIAECIDRDLPIDEAFAALHVATVKNIELDLKAYEQIITTARQPDTAHIRQQKTAAHKNFLKQIEERLRK